MPQPDPGEIELRIAVASDEERRALRGALLAARAAELAEFRRRSDRISWGYGSESARESMADEVAYVGLRGEMLDRLLAALDDIGSSGGR